MSAAYEENNKWPLLVAALLMLAVTWLRSDFSCKNRTFIRGADPDENALETDQK